MAASFAFSARTAGVKGFFDGQDRAGQPPGLWELVFSQVTTWIFARSLLNAAVLGFYYGISGVLAYTAYYASFLTGWLIVDGIRFRAGAASIQDYLNERFGMVGTICYNVIIALRLLSEVFANLLVIGIIFGSLFPDMATAPQTAIVVLAILALGYSMMGGLRASIRTDVLQMAAIPYRLRRSAGIADRRCCLFGNTRTDCGGRVRQRAGVGAAGRGGTASMVVPRA